MKKVFRWNTIIYYFFICETTQITHVGFARVSPDWKVRDLPVITLPPLHLRYSVSDQAIVTLLIVSLLGKTKDQKMYAAAVLLCLF